MRLLLAALIALLAGFLPAGPGRAQGGDAGTFLNPFPDKDRYRVQVYGDAMADGLLEGLAELMAAEARFDIDKKHRWLTGAIKADADQEAKTIEGRLQSDAPHIVVVMLGAADRIAIRRGNQRLGVGSDEWKAEYSRRLDAVMRAFRKKSVALFWIGLPVMRRQDASDDAEMMNELFRSRALANGARFVDIFAAFAEADKSYASHGPDVAGKIRLLRDQDGVHFTGAGYRKLAYFVERELKRAAQQAWDERTIPLAGSEAEQARIRPPPSVKLAPLPPSLPKGERQAGAAATAAAATVGKATDAAGGIAAENSRITLKSVSALGREEAVAIEILRPAIPAAVVSLITRRQSQDKASAVGDTVMTEILGGLTVVSAVTPLAESTSDRRRGAAGTGSPLHRVLQLGETLPPKPGRSDDMPWPRPEPVIARAPLEPAVAAPAAAGITPARAGGEAAPGDPPLPRRPGWARTTAGKRR
jgi:hypothetical protein